MRAFALLVAGGLASLLAGCGITGNFRHDPGYAAFGSPGPSDTDRKFGVSVGPLPLQIAKWVLKDDPDIGPLIEDLRAVRVYHYDVTADAAAVDNRVRTTQAELLAEGWLQVATVRETDQFVAVLLKLGEKHIDGVAVMVTEPEEVTFVNLIGDVKLDFINEYLADLDVDMPRIEIDPAELQAYAR
jgi:hypothetical protein